MFKIATSLLLVALMVSLAAQATASDKGLGLIVQNHIAAMAVDLTPSYANVKIEGSDGLLAEGAISRYRTGQVKALRQLSGTGNLGQTESSASGAAPPPGGAR